MPVFTNDSMVSQAVTGTRFQFSAQRIDKLGATEYTLVTIANDTSGSTSHLRKEMEKGLKTVVQSCRKSPRADNLLLRVLNFDDTVREVHGFKLLSECNEADYTGCLGALGGMTALYDALYTSVQASNQYGRDLVNNDFDANGIVFVITDGCNNRGTCTEKMVKEALEEAVKGENLESMVSVLIGLNLDPGTDQALAKVHQNCGLTQYVSIGDATESKLAKLADFVSKSISSQSQALGTGGASQSLVF